MTKRLYVQVRTKGLIRGEHARAGLAAVGPLVAKYRKMLNLEDTPMPVVEIRDNIGSDWTGMHIQSLTNAPHKILIQRRILADARSLERIVAHEMIHNKVVHDLGIKAADRRFDGHGREFLHYADVINQVMGACFVTPTTDRTYVVDACLRPYILLIVPHGKLLGFAWAMRPSDKQKKYIERAQSLGARVVMSTDPFWSSGGAKIGNGIALLVREQDESRAQQLAQLYENAPDRRDSEFAQFQREHPSSSRKLGFGELPPAPAHPARARLSPPLGMTRGRAR